jgi:hypothetical protein
VLVPVLPAPPVVLVSPFSAPAQAVIQTLSTSALAKIFFPFRSMPLERAKRSK